jgi:hypothetical protein
MINSTIIPGYLEPKLRNIKMKNETSNLIVTLDALAMPHLLWGRLIDEYVQNFSISQIAY